MANDERLRELEDKYEGFTVYDRDGDKIGKVDDLFVDDSDREEYIGVKMGLFGLSGTTLIPMEMARVDERERRIEVSATKEHVKEAPSYSDDDEVTANFEERILRHFNMGSGLPSGGRDPYDRDADRAAGGAVGGATAGAASTRDDTARRDRDDDDRYSGAAMGGVEDRDRADRDRTDRDRDRTDRDRMDQDRGRDDRYSGAAMGGTENRDRTDRDRIDQDRGRDDRSSGARMGGAQDRDRMDEDRTDRDSVSQEGYRNRENMGSESAMGAAGAGSAAPSGGMPDLETSERGRASDRGDRDRGASDDAGSMTRGYREGGDVGEGDQGGAIYEGYLQGYRQGLREGLREGSGQSGPRGDFDDRDEPGERGAPGSSGAMRGSGSPEEGMTRGGAREQGDRPQEEGERTRVRVRRRTQR